MEYEIRFYYSKNKKDELLKTINGIDILKFEGRLYEKTTQYNSTLEGNDFYSKEIDGRFRIRITKGETASKCMLSWKRRLKKQEERYNQEEEIETRIYPEDYDNFIYTIQNIVKMKRIESYERYRNLFINDEVEIVVDEYPFALALEIESKGENPKDIIDKYVKLLNLNYEDSYKLSWDDKYSELCKEQGIKQFSDVLFTSSEMPSM